MTESPDDLPDRLVSALVTILDGPSDAHRPHLEELCAREPAHAAALRAWMARAAPDSEIAALPAAAERVSPSSAARRMQRLRARPPLDLDRYRLDGQIAKGGMGAILRVHDQDLGRPLAMKVILGREASSGETPAVEPQAVERFLDEAQITGQLDHPGVVPVHELGVDQGGRVYFTMRLVRGRTADVVFDQARAERDGWTRTRALEVLLKICDTMAFAHAKGVLHRDLKPGNVMVGRYGEVYVMDWGLAKVRGEADRRDLRLRTAAASASRVRTDRTADVAADPDSPLMTMDGAVVGTPSYMPPEQAEGRVHDLGPPADIYAVGAMLYQLLTGWQPYVRPGTRLSPYTVLKAVVDGPPKPVQEIDRTAPAELVAICEKAMARDPAARYADMAALANDIRAFLEKRVVQAYRTGVRAETAAWVRRNRGTAVGLAAAVLALVGGASAAVAFGLAADRERASAATSAAEARRRAAEAEAQRERAEASQRAARIAAYGASIAAADAAYRQFEALNLRRYLDEAPEEHRGFEWQHLDALADNSVATISAEHSWFAELSPDGAWLLAADDDHAVGIHDTATGSRVGRLAGHDQEVVAARFSGNGRLIVTASRDRTARLWDTEKRASAFELRGHDHELLGAAFGASDRQVLTWSHDGRAIVWDVSTGTAVAVLRGHEGAVLAAGFATDGTRVATGGQDGTVRIWDAASGSETARLTHAAPVHAVVFSADGKTLLTRTEKADSQMRLTRRYEWDVAKSICREISGGELNGRCFVGATDRYVVEAGKDLEMRRCGGDVERLLAGHRDTVYDVRVLDAGMAASAGSDHTVRLWDSDAGTELAVLRGFAAVPWRLASGGTLLAVLDLAGRAKLYDAAFRDDVAHFDADSYEPALSPDGSRVAFGAADNLARVVDLASGETVLDLAGHHRYVLGLQFAADGRRLLSWSYDDTTRIWDMHTGVCEHVLAGGRKACFAPDGAHVATTGMTAHVVRLWDAAAGQEVAELGDHAMYVTDLAFDPSGSLLASASFDGVIKIHDVTGQTPGRELSPWQDGSVSASALAFSPDGALLAVGLSDATCRLLRAGDWSEAARFRHQDSVNSVAFSPDGRRLVTGVQDRTARFWDVATGREVWALRGHGDGVCGVGFSADGRAVVTKSYGRDCRVHFATPYAERYAAASQRRRDRPTAERLAAGALLAAGGSAAVAASRIAADRQTAAGERRLALELLAGRVSTEIRGVVGAIGRNAVLTAEMRAGAEAASELTEESRRAALRHIDALDDSTEALNQRVWRIVRQAGCSDDAYRAALRGARQAAAAGDAPYYVVNSLGVAAYRCRLFAEARTTLRRSAALAAAAGQPDLPEDLAFLALTEHALGFTDEARALAQRFFALHRQSAFVGRAADADMHRAELVRIFGEL